MESYRKIFRCASAKAQTPTEKYCKRNQILLIRKQTIFFPRFAFTFISLSYLCPDFINLL